MNKKRDAFRVFPLLSSVVPLSFSIDHPPTVQRLSFSVNQSPQVCGESFLFSPPLVVFPCFFQTISTVSFLLYRLLLSHLPLFVHLLFHVWHSYFLSWLRYFSSSIDYLPITTPFLPCSPTSMFGRPSFSVMPLFFPSPSPLTYATFPSLSITPFFNHLLPPANPSESNNAIQQQLLERMLFLIFAI